MSPQVSVYIATSLDGFIAREDGRIDWLDRAAAAVPPGTDLGYDAFIASVDALVIGRLTFATVLAMPAWPYGDKRVVVLATRPVAVPPGREATVSVSSEEPAALVRRLGAEGAKRLYVDGGLTVQRFLAAGLVDDLTITVIPILLGAGRRLFGPLAGDLPLRLVEARSFPCGFAQLRYLARAP